MSRDDGFLNVDLEVGARSRTSLAPLIEALHDEMFELYLGHMRGRYRAHFESTANLPDASATIRALAAVVEKLPPAARRAWRAATLRDFNVGVELARGARSVELAIAPDAVRRVAALGGRLVFTAYPAERARSRRRDAPAIFPPRKSRREPRRRG